MMQAGNGLARSSEEELEAGSVASPLRGWARLDMGLQFRVLNYQSVGLEAASDEAVSGGVGRNQQKVGEPELGLFPARTYCLVGVLVSFGRLQPERRVLPRHAF